MSSKGSAKSPSASLWTGRAAGAEGVAPIQLTWKKKVTRADVEAARESVEADVRRFKSTVDPKTMRKRVK